MLSIFRNFSLPLAVCIHSSTLSGLPSILSKHRSPVRLPNFFSNRKVGTGLKTTSFSGLLTTATQ